MTKNAIQGDRVWLIVRSWDLQLVSNYKAPLPAPLCDAHIQFVSALDPIFSHLITL